MDNNFDMQNIVESRSLHGRSVVEQAADSVPMDIGEPEASLAPAGPFGKGDSLENGPHRT